MKIYIVGCGGIGGYFGGSLAKNNNVTFVARGQNYNAIKNNGLKIKSVLGNFEINPARVIKSISKITNSDLIIFAVKTYNTEEVAKELAKVINNKTIIITFQNGVSNDLEIKKIIPSENIFPGVAYVISTKTQPGIIEQTGGLRRLFFGDRNNPKNPKLRLIEVMMKKSGIDATFSKDITKDIWKKFMLIVAFSGMTAICRSTIGKVIENPYVLETYKSCVREAINVAKAMKINVEPDAFETIMTATKNTVPQSKSSLLIDIENGRKNEIETLNGNLVRLAEKYKVEVPINKLIYSAIKLSTTPPDTKYF